MINRSTKGISSYITKRGLFICLDQINGTFEKIKASRVVSFLDMYEDDTGFVNILDINKDKVIETLYISNYGIRWACTREEFIKNVRRL